MKFVEPIRDLKKIAQIKNVLRGKGDIRNLFLFEAGLNTALRISDLLSLRVSHFFDADGTVRDFFEIRERKTGKTNRVTVTSKMKETLALYAETYPEVVRNPDSYVFFRKKAFPLGSKPIGRKMAWAFVSGICDEVGLNGAFGTHSLRKSWGFNARMQGVPMELIQKKLNHSTVSLQSTQSYLGISMAELEAVSERVSL